MRRMDFTSGLGDEGDTHLADGKRVGKDSLRIEACGAIDELSSHLGAAAAAGLMPEVAACVERVRSEMFVLGADLAMPESSQGRGSCPRIGEGRVADLERDISALAPRLGELKGFVLPGGSPGAAALHVARAVCRRAERVLVALSRKEPVGPRILAYLNRLSDWLFVLARLENRLRGVEDVLWNKDE